MNINIFCIAREGENALIAHFQKLLLGFNARLKIHNIFSNKLSSLKNVPQILKGYTELLSPHLSNKALCVSLCVEGELMDSFKFARLFAGDDMSSSDVRFFIGGAHGLEREFKKRTRCVSLSPLTLSHEVAKIVLCEQIYRSLSINNNHPYHKF